MILRWSQRASAPVGSVITLLTAGLAFAFLLSPESTAPWVTVGVFLLTTFSFVARQTRALHLCALLLSVTALTAAWPDVMKWPFHFLLPLVLYAVAVLTIPRLRSSGTGLRLGVFDRRVRLLVLGIGGTACGGVLIWYLTMHPSLETFRELLPSVPLWTLPALAMVFAAANAALEEIVFRGILTRALESAVRRAALVILIQAALFGAMHYPEGAVPNGFVGLGLTFVYGIALGAVRHRSEGLLAPWIAHTITDVAVFAVVASALLF